MTDSRRQRRTRGLLAVMVSGAGGCPCRKGCQLGELYDGCRNEKPPDIQWIL